jgi:hypothetical protein
MLAEPIPDSVQRVLAAVRESLEPSAQAHADA